MPNEEQEEWVCGATEPCGVTITAVNATRIFCPECGGDMVKKSELPEQLNV
jgi:predicted RNA-binding Zn-ribbon protein involved in translation (DUF1610 family)